MSRLYKFNELALGARVLIVLMIVTALSFFAQSALPPEASSAESDAVSSILELIIPHDTSIGQFVHSNLRKIGHFCEYGLLGSEAALFVMLYTKKRIAASAVAFTCAQFIALCDETVQIFSGRGPQISDVWIDIFGFSTLFAITLCMAVAIRALTNRLRNK